MLTIKSIFKSFWSPGFLTMFLDRRQPGPIKSVLLVIIGCLVGRLVGNAVFSETVLKIFLILCMTLGDYKRRKVIVPDFWKKTLALEIFAKRSSNQTLWLVGWLVGNVVFSETGLNIFLMFCMKLGDYKGRKVRETGFWKNFLIWTYTRKGLQIRHYGWLVGWLVGNAVSSETALRIFLIFNMKLGEYKGRKARRLDFWKTNLL